MKNFFKKESLLACSAFLIILSGCSADPLEIDQLEVKNASLISAKTETTATKPKRPSTNDDEIGSMRYMLIADSELSSDLDEQIMAIGGTVEQKMPHINAAIVRSAAPDFQVKAAAIAGVRSVLPEDQH